MSLTQGQTLNNRYRIAKLLGESSFGTFYRAWDINANGPCILEEIFDTEAGRQAFSRQAQRLLDLEHPGLLKVQDAFSLPGQGLYLAMAFVEGESLQEVFDRTDGPLPQERVLPWIFQVSAALEYLHAQQPPMIYGGLSPDGIRITPAGSALPVDFGAAAVFDAGAQTIAMSEPAAPGFSPPEQYGKGKIDTPRGCVCPGRNPVSAAGGQAPARKLSDQGKDVPPPRPVHEVNPQISPQLSAVVDQAIQIDPDQRFASAAEFKQALLKAQQGAAPVPEPVPPAVAPPKAPVKKAVLAWDVCSSRLWLF